MADLEKMKTLRKTQRNIFTRSFNRLEEICSSEYVDPIELKTEFAIFDKRSECLEETHLETLDKLASEELESEYEAVEEYRSKFILIKIKVEDILEKSKKNDSIKEDVSVSEGSSTTGSRYRLPELQLAKFDGDAKSFLGFWSQFSRVHEDEGMSDGYKFQYLLQVIIPGSKAARLIESFPPTAENYPKAIELLKDRFGRKDLLVQIYVRELLGLVMQNAVSGRKTSDLGSLYDKIESHLPDSTVTKILHKLDHPIYRKVRKRDVYSTSTCHTPQCCLDVPGMSPSSSLGCRPRRPWDVASTSLGCHPRHQNST